MDDNGVTFEARWQTQKVTKPSRNGPFFGAPATMRLAALLLLTAHAEAWGSSPKKETASESPAAAEVCASPAAGADDLLTSQVQQLTDAVGAQAARIAQLERMLAAKPAKPTKPAPAPRGAAAAAPAASLADLQPELQPFRLAEAQRALRRQQAQLQFEP